VTGGEPSGRNGVKKGGPAAGTETAFEQAVMRKKPSPGFTLIEVLIALALVSALIIGGIELLIVAAQIKLKADANIELADLAASRLEERKAEVMAGDGSASAREPAAFTVVGRRQANYRGTWDVDGLVESPARYGFEIYPELQPEAVVALTVFFSRELGF
jgi:type II secretory pathway pseudopilin PulG